MIKSIGSDIHADSGSPKKAVTVGGGVQFADTLALLTTAAGSTATESLAYAGKTTGASIAAAATNATYGSIAAAGGGGSIPTINAGYGPVGSYGGSYGGGGNLAYSVQGPGTTSVAGDVEQILADSAYSNAYLIGIQAQLGQTQTQFTALSNSLNVKHSTERSMIQNFRA